MGLLGDVGSCCLAGADGPDWLVGQDHLVPVVDLQGLELGLQVSIGLTSLSLLEGLAQTDDGIQINGLSLLKLFGHNLIGLAIKCPPLRVADQDPVDVEVLELLA